MIEITKEFDKVALISATAEDIKHFACFRDYLIVNPCIDEKYNRNIYVNKLIPDVDEQRAEIVNLIYTKRMKYDKVLVKIEDTKECKILKELLKDRCKVALYTGDEKEAKIKKVYLKKMLMLLYLLHLSRTANLLKRIFYLYSSKHILIPYPKKVPARCSQSGLTQVYYFDHEKIKQGKFFFYIKSISYTGKVSLNFAMAPEKVSLDNHNEYFFIVNPHSIFVNHKETFFSLFPIKFLFFD